MEIVPGIHWVEGVNCNVYLVFKKDKLVIVDTGEPGSHRKILSSLVSLGCRPDRVSTIVATHFHIDHAGSVKSLKQATGAKLAAHELDAPYIAGEGETPKSKSIMFRAVHSVVKAEHVKPDILLKHNCEIDGLIVIHLPGHSDGSIALLDPERKVVFVGDALRFIDGRMLGPPEHFTVDPERARESIGRLTGYHFDILLSGHGQPLRPEADKKVKAYYQSLFNHAF
jgi:glyoxylase-like metal-dependent hydrolase (beta-lactamase superfamily II)